MRGTGAGSSVLVLACGGQSRMPDSEVCMEGGLRVAV